MNHRLTRLPVRLRALFHRRRVEAELKDELRFHIEKQIEQNLAAGMSAEEARRSARRDLGGLDAITEGCREAWPARLPGEMAQDVRYGLRQLRHAPGFAAVIILSLALGIGANSAVFSLINAVMLRNLPVKDPGRLALLSWNSNHRTLSRRVFSFMDNNGGYNDKPFAWPTYQTLRDRNRVFSSLFGFVPLSQANIGIAGQSSLANGEMVTGNYFSGLGVQPVLGRAITKQDERAGAAPVTVIGYGLWTRQFGQSRQVLGKAISVDGMPFTIVGVAPREFFGAMPGYTDDLWIPFKANPKLLPYGVPEGHSMYLSRRWWWLIIMGRLQPGVSRHQAASRMDFLFRQAITTGLKPPPKSNRLPHLQLYPGARGISVLRQQFSPELRLPMILVGIVLLIACANVAGLLLARATARQGEIAVRLSLGAPRRRLIRQWLTEGLLLSLAGGALGLLLAMWGSHALLWLLQGSGQSLHLDHSLHLNLSFDGAVLSFTLAISLVTGILFSILPALQATRMRPAPVLKGSRADSSTQPGPMRLGKTLVAAQVALSLALVTAAGLFLRTLANLEHQPLGFNPRHLLLCSINPQGYKDAQRIEFYGRLLRRLQLLPGVQAATMSSNLLLAGMHGSWPIKIEGQAAKTGKMLFANYNPVGPSFFHTMGIRRLLGRGVGWQDTPAAPRVAVVNQAFARKFLGGGNPIGHTFRFGYYQFKARQFSPGYRIVGMVQDAKYARLRNSPSPTIYLPYTQAFWLLPKFGMNFELRAAHGNPLALAPAVRQTIHGLDPMLPIAALKTQSQQIATALAPERAYAWLWGLFSGLAVLLAAIGLYGLMAYAVTRRTHEIGIRMALGAERAGISRMVVREVLWLAAIGAACGLALAAGFTRFIASLLYGVRPLDAATLALAASAVLLVAALAGWLPARRAARVDPLQALRYE